MRRFITKLFSFILLLIFLMFIADILLSMYISKNNHDSPGEIEVWNDIYNGTIEADLAIYGSSRAWVHLDSRIIQDSIGAKVYNFGMDGHNFWLQYLRHQEYFRFNKHPKKILLSVDVFSLKKREDLYELEQFLPFMLWNYNIAKYTSSYAGFDFLDYYFPLIRYHGFLQGDNSVINLDCKKKFRFNGYRGMNRKWNNDLDIALENGQQNFINLDSTSVSLLENFIIECKKNNIQIILLYTPEYIEGQCFIRNRKEILSIYDNLSKKYNLFFLDYSADEISYKKYFFYNASHLNKKGSEIFTKKLVQDLKKLNIY